MTIQSVLGTTAASSARGMAVAVAAALFAGLVGCAGPARTAAPTVAAPAAAEPEASIAVTAAMGSPHAGDPAPDFELSDQHGQKVRLSDLRGSVVLLAFVTSWCPFSQAEQPHLARVASDYAGKNVRVLAVDIKEPDAGYRRYVDRVAMPFPVLRDPTGDVVASFTPARAQPEVKDRAAVLVTSNLVLDANGVIRFFTMVDTANFDAELVHARRAIDALLGASHATTAAGGAREPALWEQPGLGGAVRPEMGSPQPGEAAPDFDLPALAGGSARLSSFRGAWVVLHFTATWCPYCDAEIAHLGALADRYAARNVKVVVVDLQEDAGVWATYARARVSSSLVALSDHTGAAALRFAPPRAQPSFADRAQVLFDATLIVDPAGVIRLFLLPDSAHFDPSFGGVRRELDRMLGDAPRPVDPIASGAADVLAPGSVVAVSARAEGEDAVAHLAIAPGYHVMSDRPADAFQIPTRVRALAADGTELGEVLYPKATVLDYDGGGARAPLSTFGGDLDVRVRGGARATAVVVRYQACTASRCLAPFTRRVELVR